MKTTTAHITDKGVRAVNEDCVHLFRVEDVDVAVVSDGLGGHGDGEIASKLVIETIETCFKMFPEFSEENIKQILYAAHQNILALHSGEKNCKATVVVAFMKQDEIIVAHSGDSRFYSFGLLGITHMTRDHSVSQMAVDMGQISHEDIRNSPDRNKVLHCLGGSEFKVVIHRQKRKNHTHKGILLCTDGFWQNVSEKEMMATLRKSKDAKQWMEQMISILEAKQDEKQDNYSAIVVMNK